MTEPLASLGLKTCTIMRSCPEFCEHVAQALSNEVAHHVIYVCGARERQVIMKRMVEHIVPCSQASMQFQAF